MTKEEKATLLMEEIKERKLKMEDMGEELCEYCPLERKGTWSTPGGGSAGCEGSHCENAYDMYISTIEE